MKLARTSLLVFGLLDAMLLGRFLDSIAFSHFFSVSHDPWWFQASMFVRPFFLLSLGISALGLATARRWGFILSYVQFPLRFVYLYLSFGFLTLFNPLFGNHAYQALLIAAMVLEGARLVVTILLHRKISQLSRK